MRKKIPKEIETKIEQIFTELSNIKNTVPYDLRTTFTFKGRKSVQIGEKIISALSEPGDLLYDPFMGGSSFILSAVHADRKIIATELDNYTYNAVKILFENCDTIKLESYYKKIESDVKQEIMDLYATNCCGEKNYINKLLYDPEDKEYFHPTTNREIVDGENIKLVFDCPVCGKKSKSFTKDDLAKINQLEKVDTSNFPHTRYIENSRINITASTGADYYDRIFTQRNKIALLKLQEAIDKIPSGKEKDFLEHVLVASLSLSRIAMYGSSTDILYHVVPHGAQEMNVWILFQQKYDSFVKFKEQNPSVQVNNIKDNEKYHIYNCDYKDFLDKHPDLIFDIIYTDFPYTDQVPYLERNQLYRQWLSIFVDDEKYKLTPHMLKNEIVLTNAPSRPQKQNIENYYKDIDIMFRYLDKYVKDGGFTVFTMKLGKEKYFKTYIETINLARKNGFEYVFRIGIEKNDPTMRKQSAYANTFINEIVVIFYKLSNNERYWYFADENYEFILIKKIYNYLLKSNKPVTLTTAVSITINDLKSRYKYIANKDDIERIQKVLNRNFILDKGTIQINPNSLYLEIEDESSLYTKLYDLIPIYIGKLIKSKGKFVLEDLYFELINSLCDGNPNTINQILENKQHQNDITNLIENYCDIQGGYYVEKKDIIKPNEDAIDISQFSGDNFEFLIKKLLNAEGYLNIVVKGGAGDLGVDIIASKLTNSGLKHYIIQCKRWIANVGSEPIQRLYAERDRLNVDYAACYTTSDYTKDGKMVAKDLSIDIINGNELMTMLNRHFPGEYYNGAPI